MKASLAPRLTTAAVITLVAVLLVDFILIGLHLWHESWRTGGKLTEWFEYSWLSLASDGGLGEWTAYLQLSIAAALLVVIAVRDGAPVLAAWALTLAVAVADDALTLHENGGEALVDALNLPAGAYTLAEFAVWAGMAAVLLPVLALTHRASDRSARATSWRLALLLVALIFFAAVVDVLDIAWGAGVFEDGGELIVSTLILVAVIDATAWPSSDAPARRRARYRAGDAAGSRRSATSTAPR
jgi:hypothetical protein